MCAEKHYILGYASRWHAKGCLTCHNSLINMHQGRQYMDLLQGLTALTCAVVTNSQRVLTMLLRGDNDMSQAMLAAQVEFYIDLVREKSMLLTLLLITAC